jgi:hypothetical protein
MKLTRMKALYWTVRVAQNALSVVWVLFLVGVLQSYSTGGTERMRDYILHVTDTHRLIPYTPPDKAGLVETAYQALLLLLAITWGMRELTQYLRKRLIASDGTAIRA